MSALFNVLLGLESPFSEGGVLVAAASFDGVRVASLVEVTRRQMLRAEEEAERGQKRRRIRPEEEAVHFGASREISYFQLDPCELAPSVLV